MYFSPPRIYFFSPPGEGAEGAQGTVPTPGARVRAGVPLGGPGVRGSGWSPAALSAVATRWQRRCWVWPPAPGLCWGLAVLRCHRDIALQLLLFLLIWVMHNQNKCTEEKPNQPTGLFLSWCMQLTCGGWLGPPPPLQPHFGQNPSEKGDLDLGDPVPHSHGGSKRAGGGWDRPLQPSVGVWVAAQTAAGAGAPARGLPLASCW